MNVIIFSTDRKIFEKGSAVRDRMLSYASLTSSLRIIVFTRNRLFHKEKLGENIWIYPTASFSKFFYISDSIRIARRIFDANSSAPTLLTAQDPFETGFAAWVVSKMFKVPLQLQVHTDFLSPFFLKDSFLNRVRVRIGKILLRKASCVRVVSERIRKSLIAHKLVVPEKISVLPIFVDVSPFRTIVRSRFLIERYPQFKFFFLMMSRLEREKNIELAIRAFREANVPCEVSLVIVGSGSQEKKLKKIALELGLKDQVIFTGWVEEPALYYESANAFLSSSNYEGYGLSLVEAALHGLPVISTDVGMIGEVLTADNALITPVQSQKGLSEKIAWSLQHPKELAVLGEKGRGAAEGAFAQGKEAYLSAYRLVWEKCVI